jgi:hypothetical protein
MDDVRAVMDAAGSARAALFGFSEGGPMSGLFAATYPERTTALIMHGSFPRRTRRADYPWGPTDEEWAALVDQAGREWGGPVWFEARAPSRAQDRVLREWWARALRLGASPAANRRLLQMNTEIDVRHVLPAIRVPTLILHSVGDLALPVEGSRWMAGQIRGAKYVELPGPDHAPWLSDADQILDETEEFLTGVRHGPEPDRVLATVMFADIVGSTEKAAELDDRRWRELLDHFHGMVRAGSSAGSAGARSTRRVTASSRPSTGPRGRFAAPRPSRRGCGCSTWRCEPAYTGASARSWPTSWAGSPSTSAPGSRPRRSLARSSCPAP